MNFGIVDTEFLAKFFDKAERTIRDWASSDEMGMPKEGHDSYDFEKVIKWRLNYLQKENEILKNSGDEKLHAMKIRGQEIKNKKDEIELKKALGKLIEKKPALIAWSNQINIIKSHINSMRHDLTTELSLNDDEVKSLNKTIDGFLEILAHIEIEKYIVNEEALADLEETELNNIS